MAAAAGQSAAATQIDSIAGNVRTHLLSCAVAGTAFYTLLAAVLVKLVIAAASALVAFGSVVFSWAGAAIIIEEAALNTFLVQGSMTALTAFLAAQATALVVLHGEAVDSTNFPEGRWPRSDTAAFDDATVTDGDADWSLRR